MLIFCSAGESLHPCLHQEPLSKVSDLYNLFPQCLFSSGRGMKYYLSEKKSGLPKNICKKKKTIVTPVRLPTKVIRLYRQERNIAAKTVLLKSNIFVKASLKSYLPCSSAELEHSEDSVWSRNFQADRLKVKEANSHVK